MKKENVEDVFIGYNDIQKRKKGKKGVVIVFIILILVLTGIVSAYFYFTNQVLTKKQTFINSISSTNVKKFLENDIYIEIVNRMLNENSETESKINFSTTEELENLQEIDITNFELNLINKNDVNNSKSYNELGLNYSGNEVFKVKLQSSEEAIAVASDEIVDRYVGIHYDKIKDVFGVDFNKDDINTLKKSEKIDLTDQEKEEYLKTYTSKFFENIPEDKFTSQDNIVINKNNTSVDVVAYTLNLSEEEFDNVMINVLDTLKNDEDLLKKIVTGENNNSNNTNENSSEEDNINENNEVENNTQENTAIEGIEADDSSINLYNETNSSEQVLTPTEANFNSSLEIEADNAQTNLEEDVTSVNTDATESLTENNNLEEDSSFTDSLDTEKSDILSKIIFSMIFNTKIDTTAQELQNEIETLIDEIKNTSGNGINMTVYVSESGTEKISLVLQNEDTIDIEFTKNPEDENNNTIQITYLYKNDTASDPNQDGVVTYSAEDNIDNNGEDVISNKKDGVTLTLNKISKDTGVNLKINCSFIDKEEINEKIDLEIKTNGTKMAKTIDNEIVVGFKTNENEAKVVVENKINFELSSDIGELNNDNCVFLDELPDEERNNLITAIIERVMAVYQEKKEGLKVIDSNTGTSFVEQNDLDNVSSRVTKEEAKNALFNKVSVMMGEAQNNNEEFTIKNLENLEIEGYEVSSTVTEEAAVIVVDTYTFRITPNFELLEE